MSDLLWGCLARKTAWDQRGHPSDANDATSPSDGGVVESSMRSQLDAQHPRAGRADQHSGKIQNLAVPYHSVLGEICRRRVTFGWRVLEFEEWPG